MVYIHVLMAVFAVWRLTEVMVADQVSARFRKWACTDGKFCFWACHRCMSVWMGVVAAVAFVYFPWALWPFALSQMCLVINQIHTLITQHLRRGIYIDPVYGSVDFGGMSPETAFEILRKVLAQAEATNRVRGGR
jgi:hypothetical protein